MRASIFQISMVLWILMGACSNNIEDIDELFDPKIVQQEETRDVEIFYSDSAIVRIKVSSPVLIRILDRKNPKDEFPEGIEVEFYNNAKRTSSWLKSDYAIRFDDTGEILLKKNVVLYNSKQEKLETSEMLWNEKERTMETNKFVMITRPEQGDTSLGFGIIVTEDFSRFEVKHKFSAKLKLEELEKSLQRMETSSDTL